MNIEKIKIAGKSVGICIVILGLNFTFAKKPILYHFYTVDKLTEVFYESKNNKYKFDGAVCNDGWISHSQGRGTCSWHDGVFYYFYKGNYIKTKEECRIEAKKFSWIE